MRRTKDTTRTRLNALGHGITSPRPVLPGVESEDDWTAFRDGTVSSLAPEGPLERELAERVALSLWRLRRVARYETGAASAALDRAPEDAAASILKQEEVTSRAQLVSRLDHARAVASFVRAFQDLPDDELLSAEEAMALVDLALTRNPQAPRDALQLTPEVLFRNKPVDDRGASLPGETRLLDIPSWTAGGARAVCAAIVLDRENTDWSLQYRPNREHPHFSLAALARMNAAVAEGDTAAASRRVSELESLLTAYDAETDHLRRERSLPPPEALDRVTRYEAHLNRQYATALAQLESLQSRRRSHSPSVSTKPEITKRTPNPPNPPTPDTPPVAASETRPAPAPPLSSQERGRGVRSEAETTKQAPLPNHSVIQDPKSLIQIQDVVSSRQSRRRKKRPRPQGHR